VIVRSIVVGCLLLTLSTPALSETDKYIGSKIYVPDNRLEKIFEVPEGEVFIVRGNTRRMDNFVELWARVVLRNHDQETIDMWNNEKVAVNFDVDYAHFKMHFYCNNNQAAIPAAYLFNRWSELIDSKVVLIDEPFSTENKPVTKHIKNLACSGRLDSFD
jgi:hypothetical protein